MAQAPDLGYPSGDGLDPREWERWRGGVDERFNGIASATATAFAEMNRRLDAMNELRAQIGEERGRYLSVDQYDAKHEDLIRRVSMIERANAETIGNQAGIDALLRRFLVVIGLLVAFLGVTVTVLLAVVQ